MSISLTVLLLAQGLTSACTEPGECETATGDTATASVVGTCDESCPSMRNAAVLPPRSSIADGGNFSLEFETLEPALDWDGTLPQSLDNPTNPPILRVAETDIPAEKTVNAALETPSVEAAPLVVADESFQIAQTLDGEPVETVLVPADDPLGDAQRIPRPAPAAPDEPMASNPAPAFEIGLAVVADDRYLGDANVLVQGERIRVSQDDLIRLLEPDLTVGAIDAIRNSGVDGWLEIGTFKIEGIDVAYDPALQQITLTTPLDARARRSLRLSTRAVSGERADVIEPGEFSFFVNPRMSVIHDWDDVTGDGSGFRPVVMSFNAGGRLFGEDGIGFLSRQSWTSGDNGGFRRSETVAYYDIESDLIRLSAGDLRPRGVGFQSLPGVAGFSIERFFDFDPTRLFRPVGQSEFEIERASTVEVRLNGVTRREIYLQPGRYSLDDLPLSQGANLLDLVVRDELGQERLISDSTFFDFDLLEPGISDFSLSAGVKTGFDDSGVTYSDDLAITGLVRRGIRDDLTLGADIQGDETGANGGLSSLWATPLGIWRLQGAVSDYEDLGSGYAGELGYRYIGANTGKWGWSINANARYFSRDFSTLRGTSQLGTSVITLDDTLGNDPFLDLDDTPLSTRPFSTLFNGGLRLTRDRFSASATGTYSLGRDQIPDRSSLIAGVNYSVNNRLSFGAFARYFDDGEDTDTSAFFQINYRIGRDRSIRSVYDTTSNDVDVQYTKSAPFTVGAPVLQRERPRQPRQ